MDPTPNRPRCDAGPLCPALDRAAAKRRWLLAFGLVLLLAGGALPASDETAEAAENAEIAEAGEAGETGEADAPLRAPAGIDASTESAADGADASGVASEAPAPDPAEATDTTDPPTNDPTFSPDTWAHAEPVGQATEWHRRIGQLLLDVEVGQAEQEDVDRLYAELSSELWPLQAEVHDAIHANAPDLVERHAELTALYAERSRLFDAISPRLHRTVTSLDPLGRDEFEREVEYLRTNLEYQDHILQSAFEQLRENVVASPSGTIRGVVVVLAAIWAFRLWRRWLRAAIPDWRKSLLAARPRRRGPLRMARLLWYFERIRTPFEWLVLLWVVSLFVQPPGFEEILALGITGVEWLLFGWLAVTRRDAMAERGAGGLRRGTASLRLRSLQVAGYWGILLGLALDLTARYAGSGVVYVWVARAWLVLSLPVLVLLVHWWRPVIFERLRAQSEPTAFAQRIAARSKGFASYVAAAAGGALLLWNGFLKLIVRVLSATEIGRRVIAVLVRREVARDVDRAHLSTEEPIADEIILPLIAARDVLIDEIGRGVLNMLVASIRARGGGGNVVIGERGAGKTVFLQRVATELGDTMRIVDCPAGGWPAFEAALGDAFGVAPGEGFGARLSEALEREGVTTVGIDNCHRLPRPFLGGQEPLVALAELNEAIGDGVSWVFAVDRHAWHYILRAGAERTTLHQTLALPTWTEENLAELVARRAEAIGLEPDYGRLVLPRQLDVGEHEDADDRNRYGYARVLWELADGNPEVALYLFAESLRRLPDESVILRLPQLRSASSLTDAHPDALLVLRALVQCDYASVGDVAANVRLSHDRVETILHFCIRNGWVIAEDGSYRVSWRWYRSVTRALVRQNLMPR